MPALIPQVLGVPEVIKSLRRKNAMMALGISRGVRKASLHLQRESQKLVPVDTGNLKASAFARVEGTGYNTVGSVGYTAAYAIYVHENVQMKLKGQPRSGSRGKYWDPQGRAQAKFLEEPARRLAPELLKMIRDEGRIR